MSKSCLKWITIASEQAMLMFVCLQNMVDELLNKKDGNDFNNIQVSHTAKNASVDRRLGFLSQILLKLDTFRRILRTEHGIFLVQLYIGELICYHFFFV